MKVKTKGASIDVKTVQLKRDDSGIYELQLIDQRFLPHQLRFFTTTKFSEAKTAISTMVVRGAPAIGVTAIFAMVLAIQLLANSGELTLDKLNKYKESILQARPTAKDLESFINRFFDSLPKNDEITIDQAVQVALKLMKESEDECYAIGEQSEHLIQNGMGVLTHCNAGALATVDYGTALSPMRLAHYQGREFIVYVDETRPRLQGMLTAWELSQEDIEHVIIVDNAAGYFMQEGKIQVVITGCDRVIRDGSVTNKIGTLEKAILAKTFNIPFYVAMPFSTYDPSIQVSTDIPIEFRDDKEITHFQIGDATYQISHSGSKTMNPAFDTTPAEYITGYITKYGILTKDQLEKYHQKHQQQ
ncbi:MAG: S-methyl-5-thioribose-1-phosphate isomerase [Candidatus Kariarchaeaceae archaeon]|jgi:S-methyl-5-thioribose-1-phosphate isomerase